MRSKTFFQEDPFNTVISLANIQFKGHVGAFGKNFAFQKVIHLKSDQHGIAINRRGTKADWVGEIILSRKGLTRFAITLEPIL